jgi:hypothetical protein
MNGFVRMTVRNYIMYVAWLDGGETSFIIQKVIIAATC